MVAQRMYLSFISTGLLLNLSNCYTFKKMLHNAIFMFDAFSHCNKFAEKSKNNVNQNMLCTLN